jgi:DNA modification methylase
LKVQTWPLERIKPYPKNAKKHPKKQVEALARQIEAHGFDVPIVVDTEGVVIKGHGRLLALTHLGRKDAQVIVRSDLTPSQVKAARIADNRLAQTDWDDELLREELDALIAEAYDPTLADFTFKIPPVSVPGLTDEDDVPDLEEKNPRGVVRGQVWKLGRHRLMCGDAKSVGDVRAVTKGLKVDLAFTSPPYNHSKNTVMAGAVPGFEEKYGTHNDAMDDGDYRDLLIGSTKAALAVTGYAFVNLQLLTHNRVPLIEYQYEMRAHLKDILVWNKAQCPPNIVKGAFNTKWEYVFAFANDVRTRGFPCDWRGQYPNVVETASNAGNEFADTHKAGFPVAFPLWFLERLDFAKVVLDQFGGTGTTLIACERAGRTGCMLEIDPHYCSVIIARWEAFTGQTAELVEGPQ